MTPLIQKLAQYAAYHRDQRNILTHFVGIPMIVLSVIMLLSRPTLFTLGDWPVSVALLGSLWTAAYYLRLDARYGLVMSVFLALCVLAGAQAAQASTTLWLSTGLGLFVVGWVIQFIGHYYEGRKPAFVDDLIGLIIGPLFVLAELGFLLGLRKEVEQAIEQEAGPVRKHHAAVGH